MRKDALTLMVVTVTVSIFGFFFRWVQTLNGFEAETGLPVRGAGSTMFVTVYFLLAALTFAVMAVLYKSRYRLLKTAGALRPATAAPNVLCRIAGAGTALVCAVLLFTAGDERYAAMQRLFAGAGLCGGAAMYFVCAGGKKHPAGRYAAPVLTLFDCVWLVCCYKFNAEDPVVGHFAVEILALVFTTLAWYALSAFYYGRAKPARAMFTLELAIFLDIVTLADGHGILTSVLYALQCAALLCFFFLLVENMQKKTPEPEEEDGEPS